MKDLLPWSKIWFLQVVASEDRIPRNTETKRKINSANHGEDPKSRKGEETNPPRDYVPKRDDPKSSCRDSQRCCGFSITESNDSADLALTLLAGVGDVHPNRGPTVKCPVCTKGIYDKNQQSVWFGRGGYVHLKCTNLTNSRQCDKNFDCNNCKERRGPTKRKREEKNKEKKLSDSRKWEEKYKR